VKLHARPCCSVQLGRCPPAPITRATVALLGGGARNAEQVGNLGPRVLLVSGIGHSPRQTTLRLRHKAGKKMHGGAGIAQPWTEPNLAESLDGSFEDALAVIANPGTDVMGALRSCHSCIENHTTLGLRLGGHPTHEALCAADGFPVIDWVSQADRRSA